MGTEVTDETSQNSSGTPKSVLKVVFETTGPKIMTPPHYIDHSRIIAPAFWQIINKCTELVPFTKIERAGYATESRSKMIIEILAESPGFRDLFGLDKTADTVTFDPDDISESDLVMCITESAKNPNHFYANPDRRRFVLRFALRLIETPFEYSPNWDPSINAFRKPTFADRFTVAAAKVFGPVSAKMDFTKRLKEMKGETEQEPLAEENKPEEGKQTKLINPYIRRNKDQDSAVSSLTSGSASPATNISAPKGDPKETWFEITRPPVAPFETPKELILKRNSVGRESFKNLTSKIWDFEPYAHFIPIDSIPNRARPEKPLRRIRKGSPITDYPLTSFAQSFYGIGSYLRQSGESTTGRFLIQHRMDAEELCKQVNAYNDDDTQDLLVPTEMDKQYIMKVAKVQDAFPTSTHWIAGSDRHTLSRRNNGHHGVQVIGRPTPCRRRKSCD